MRVVALGFVIAVCAGSAAHAAAQDTMKQTANAFYAAYEQTRPRGIPDANARAVLAPLLSPGLNGLIGKAQAAEDQFRAVTQGQSPPLLEGDIFTSLFEGANSYAVGDCTASGGKGACKVSLTYEDPHNKPMTWNDTLMLVDTGSGWRVDDIAYGGNWDFANKGHLRETLNYAIRNADGE